MPNVDKLRNQIESELSKNNLDPIWIWGKSLECAYGPMKLAPETRKHYNLAITGVKLNGYYRFLKGFYGPAVMPTIFHMNIDRTLGHYTPIWLNDIIVKTRGTEEQHTKGWDTVITKLKNECYRASRKKLKFHQKETLWLGHTISPDGIRSNEKKQRPSTTLTH